VQHTSPCMACTSWPCEGHRGKYYGAAPEAGAVIPHGSAHLCSLLPRRLLLHAGLDRAAVALAMHGCVRRVEPDLARACCMQAPRARRCATWAGCATGCPCASPPTRRSAGAADAEEKPASNQSPRRWAGAANGRGKLTGKAWCCQLHVRCRMFTVCSPAFVLAGLPPDLHCSRRF
jgi:hypothetical protein